MSDEIREDDVARLRQDLEALSQLLRDPVVAAQMAYETLLALRQNGQV